MRGRLMSGSDHASDHAFDDLKGFNDDEFGAFNNSPDISPNLAKFKNKKDGFKLSLQAEKLAGKDDY